MSSLIFGVYYFTSEELTVYYVADRLIWGIYFSDFLLAWYYQRRLNVLGIINIK